MDERTLELLWIGSFRYHLGRQTYAVSEFVHSTCLHWPNIPQRAQTVIKRDLMEAFEADTQERLEGYPYPRLGDKCDRAQWEKLRDVVNQSVVTQ